METAVVEVLVIFGLDLAKEKGAYQSAHLTSYFLLGVGLSVAHLLLRSVSG